MIYLQAFIFSGVLCALAQFVLVRTKLGFMNTLRIVIALGTIAGMIGIFGPLVDFGMMGVIISISSLCNQFFDSIGLLLRGTFFNFIAFVILLLSVVIFGSICGVLAKVPVNVEKEEQLNS